MNKWAGTAVLLFGVGVAGGIGFVGWLVAQDVRAQSGAVLSGGTDAAMETTGAAERGVSDLSQPATVRGQGDQTIADAPVAAELPKDTDDIRPRPEPPRFDLVRAEVDGLTLVAGVAHPGTDLAILVNNSEAARTQSDGDGRFVQFLDLPNSAAPRVLTLLMYVEGEAIESVEEVILTPTVGLLAEADTGASIPETTTQNATQNATQELATGVAPDETAPEAPETVAIAAVEAPARNDAPVAATGATTTVSQAGHNNSETTARAGLATPVIGSDQPAAADQAAVPRPQVEQDVAALSESAPAPVGSAAVPTADANAPQTPDVPKVAITRDNAAAPTGTTQQDIPRPDLQTAAIAPENTPTGVPGETKPKAVTGAPLAQPQGATVLISRPDGVEVLQAPQTSGTAPEVTVDLALDAISYDTAGDVSVSGRGEGGFVRIYLDNAPIMTSPVAPDGKWNAELPQVDTGVYTLRVDRLSDAGDVVARVESPFKREDPAVLAQAAAQQPDSPIKAITVQPGNTLWAIARDRYGEGVEYVRVFQANRDRIRNPDLIYPGQVFDLPE